MIYLGVKGYEILHAALSYPKNKIEALNEILKPPLHPTTMIYLGMNLTFLPEGAVLRFWNVVYGPQLPKEYGKQISDTPIPPFPLPPPPPHDILGGEL